MAQAGKKAGKYAVHPDFAHYPHFPMPFNSVLLALLNAGLKLDIFLRQRKLLAKAVQHQVPSIDGYAIPVFQFNPDNIPADKNLPAMVYYHGGAFVLGYASTHIVAMDMYAQMAQCRVFMVDYRLAPEYIFPKAFEDSFSVLQWVANCAGQLGVDAKKIAVGGDSAGGTLAAAVAQKVADHKSPAICGQLLVYPALDKNSNTPSATQFLDTPLWDGVSNKKMWALYLRDVGFANTPPYAAPADRGDMSGLVPAYIENAEFDPLRDEAEAYATRLQSAGVNTVFNPTRGTVHGYDTVFDSAISQAAMARRLDFLRGIFS